MKNRTYEVDLILTGKDWDEYKISGHKAAYKLEHFPRMGEFIIEDFELKDGKQMTAIVEVTQVIYHPVSESKSDVLTNVFLRCHIVEVLKNLDEFY